MRVSFKANHLFGLCREMLEQIAFTSSLLTLSVRIVKAN